MQVSDLSLSQFLPGIFREADTEKQKYPTGAAKNQITNEVAVRRAEFIRFVRGVMFC
jgi:hypothetical protein